MSSNITMKPWEGNIWKERVFSAVRVMQHEMYLSIWLQPHVFPNEKNLGWPFMWNKLEQLHRIQFADS